MHELPTRSLWHDTVGGGESAPTRAALEGRQEADVVIVGGGYTGLWTAYYLLQRDPTLSVTVLEAHEVGFGASGRNGGWCSALLPMTLDAMAGTHGTDSAVRLQREMHATVGEVGRVVEREGIECHFAHGGSITMARNTAQRERLEDHVRHLQQFGFTDDDYTMLGREQALQRCAATGVVGAEFTPHCAAVHPARLARGLATTVENHGGLIHEQSPVVEMQPHRVRTAYGEVTARTVVRATEAFTARLAGSRRQMVPIYSLMIATEPLAHDFWERTGLSARETFADGRHMVIYGQRTADDRLAFGGRGAWYHWGSAMSPGFEGNDRVHRAIHGTLRELFPHLGDARITHRWGGAVAAARDWWAHVAYDAVTGMASAGNYVGDGVGSANLAGRTLADLVTGTDSDLCSLPWVGHRSRKWEPEPFRWLGINSLMVLPVGADRHEARTGRRSRWREAVLDTVLGGP